MSFKIAEGYVEVTADGRPIAGKVASDINRNSGPLSTIGAGMGAKIVAGTLGAIAAVGIGSKIVEFFGDGINYASDLNETINKSSTIFGGSQSRIESWSKTSVTALGLSKEAAINAAARFGDIFTQTGFLEDAAASASTKVVQMAADLGSFSNLDTADVTDRIAAALRGEYDSLKAVIPGISAARVEREALALSGKKNVSQITAQEKAQAVLNIIEKDGARAMGDFARTSDGFANTQKIVAAQAEELSGKFGTMLLPIAQKFQSFLGTSLIPALSSFGDWLGQNAETLKFVGSIVLGAIAGFTLFQTVLFATRVPMLLVTAAQWLFNVALAANPIGLVVTAIGALVAGLIYFFTQTELGREVWANVTSFIGTAMTWLWESVLKPVIDAIAGAWDWLYNTIILPIVTGIMIYVGLWAAVFTWLWETVLRPIFVGIGALFSWLWANVIGPIVGFIGANIRVLGIIFKWLWENAVSPALSALGAGFGWLWANVISPVADFIGGAISKVGNTTKTIFGGIAKFIGAAFQAALSVVKGPINGIIGLVNGVIKALNSIHVTIPSWVPIVGGQTFGLHLNTLPMLANGGIFRTAGLAIVGERGPEILSAGAGAQVTPLSRASDLMPQIGGGGGTHLHFEEGSVTIDASEVEDFNRVISIFSEIGQEARRGKKKKAA